MPMVSQAATLEDLVARAANHAPIRVAVIAADQGLVLKSVAQAKAAGLIEPHLIGDPEAIISCAKDADVDIDRAAIIAAKGEVAAARAGPRRIIQ